MAATRPSPLSLILVAAIPFCASKPISPRARHSPLSVNRRHIASQTSVLAGPLLHGPNRQDGGATSSTHRSPSRAAKKKSLANLFRSSRDRAGVSKPAAGLQPFHTLAELEPVKELPPEVLAGSAIGLFPFVYATYEFALRIYTQRQCGMCEGVGLVYRDQDGDWLPGGADDVFAKRRLRKCPTCGGFVPWLGWGFFFMSNKYVDPGKGGPLQRPSKNFKEMSDKAREKRKQKEAAAAAAAALAAEGDEISKLDGNRAPPATDDIDERVKA